MHKVWRRKTPQGDLWSQSSEHMCIRPSQPPAHKINRALRLSFPVCWVNKHLRSRILRVWSVTSPISETEASVVCRSAFCCWDKMPQRVKRWKYLFQFSISDILVDSQDTLGAIRVVARSHAVSDNTRTQTHMYALTQSCKLTLVHSHRHTCTDKLLSYWQQGNKRQRGGSRP